MRVRFPDLMISHILLSKLNTHVKVGFIRLSSNLNDLLVSEVSENQRLEEKLLTNIVNKLANVSTWFRADIREGV